MRTVITTTPSHCKSVLTLDTPREVHAWRKRSVLSSAEPESRRVFIYRNRCKQRSIRKTIRKKQRDAFAFLYELQSVMASHGPR